MSDKASHVSAFLRCNQAASTLLEGVDRDARLLADTRRILAPELRPHCLHTSLEAGRLVLVTDGSVWASRLRFAAPELLAGLGGQGVSAATLRVLVAPSPDTQSPENRYRQDGGRPPNRLSPETVAHLRMAAAAMDDPALAAALLRLAETGRALAQDNAKGRGT
jgi:hypothetical protein